VRLVEEVGQIVRQEVKVVPQIQGWIDVMENFVESS